MCSPPLHESSAPVVYPASSVVNRVGGMALFAFSVAPSASDDTGSVSAAVADALRVVRDSGLPYELTSMFTTIEGEWEEVMPVVKAACDAVDRAVQTHGGFGASQEYGVAGLLVATRVGRIAPVSREMILNFVSMHSLGLPKSY